MHKSRENSLKRLFDVFSSDEVKNSLGLTDNEVKILNEFWVNQKKRNDLATELGISPNYLSKRYSTILKKVKSGITELAVKNLALRQKIDQLSPELICALWQYLIHVHNRERSCHLLSDNQCQIREPGHFC